MGLNVYLATQWKVIHPIPASFPLSAPVELEVVKAEGGVEWGIHLWSSLTSGLALKRQKKGGSICLVACLSHVFRIGSTSLVVRSSSGQDAHDLRFWRASFPLTSWVRIQECTHWLAVRQMITPPPQKHSSGSIARLSENNRILEAQQGQGPALTTAEDQPLMHWSQVCDKSLISSTQYALFACVKWGKMRLTRTIPCWCPNHTPPHSH